MSSTRFEVIHHRSDLGRWRAAKRQVEPHLCDYVLGYFASESFLPTPLYERHLPAREVTIALNFGAPHRIIGSLDKVCTGELRTAWIAGLQHCHQIREAVGARDFLVIRLTPIGAHMLLGAPMEVFADRVVPLEDIDANLSRLLISCAEGTPDWARRFDAIEKVITARLASAAPAPAGLLYAWRTLQESPNHVDLRLLPEQLGCSRRHLIAQFHKYFGMAPKMVARVSRFHLALAAVSGLRQRRTPPLARDLRFWTARRTLAHGLKRNRRRVGPIWRSIVATTTNLTLLTSSDASPGSAHSNLCGELVLTRRASR